MTLETGKHEEVADLRSKSADSECFQDCGSREAAEQSVTVSTVTRVEPADLRSKSADSECFQECGSREAAEQSVSVSSTAGGQSNDRHYWCNGRGD